MTVQILADSNLFEVLYLSEDAAEKEITGVYCCDLLSIAMTKVPARAAWVTVMSNLNTLAVASLTEAACVILAEGAVKSINKRTSAIVQVAAMDFSDAVMLARHAESIGADAISATPPLFFQYDADDVYNYYINLCMG